MTEPTLTWGRDASGNLRFYDQGKLAGVIPKDRLPELILSAAQELQRARVRDYASI